MITAVVVVVAAAVIWTCALQMRKMNRAMPRIVWSAAFLAITSTHDTAEDGTLVPIGSIKADDMVVILNYLRDHFGVLDKDAIDALRASIPTI